MRFKLDRTLMQEDLDLSKTVDLTQDLAALLSFASKVAFAIRQYSYPYAIKGMTPDPEFAPNDVYWLSTCLIDLGWLAQCISEGGDQKILSACNQLSESFLRYLGQDVDSYVKAVDQTHAFERNKQRFNLKDGIDVLNAIVRKIIHATSTLDAVKT